MLNRLWVGMASALTAIVLVAALPAQQNPSNAGNGDQHGSKSAKGGIRTPAPPAPRMPSGTVSFGPNAGETGLWQGPVVGLTTAADTPPSPPGSGPATLNIRDVPFQRWAKGVYDYRRSTLTADDPHVRCKSSGGARLYHTPYGFEIIQVEDLERILITGVGGPHTYRTVYMDGRPHPSNQDPRIMATPSGGGRPIASWWWIR